MHQHGYIGRKMRSPKLQDKPAVIITAFGCTHRDKVALTLLKQRLAKEFTEYKIFWAYTSEIIRKRENLPSLQETLARVEAAGYRQAVVQPLHVFPGTEYLQLTEICSFFPGLRIIIGETLCHRWDFIREVLADVSTDFLAEEGGLNLLALHGTPLAADPVNIVYLGIERLLDDLYPNVLAATIEGVPDHQAVMEKIKRNNLTQTYNRIRIIPMMFLAGLHVEDDLMGAEDSWRRILEGLGFSVDCPAVIHEDHTFYKGLAFRSKCIGFYTDRLCRALNLIRCY